ncbi:MAG: PASTA domain-containing protein [Eubacteriales bacterium]|nr:PASTA domain-containing protein [Eubacteriales bacterium]
MYGKLIKGGIAVGKILSPEAINFGAKLGTELLEKQKSMVKIPDLKDVPIDEALRILRDELHLTPTSAVANPSAAYADESENEVMYSEPRFGSRVGPGTTVKVYHLTQEVIDKSKELAKNAVHEFKVPEMVGLTIYEAREDLERLGIKVAEKLEKPDLKFAEKEDGQVTKVTYPNDHKIGSKLRSGDRVSIYYVNEEVILESKAIKDQKSKDRQAVIDKIGKVSKDVSKGIYAGTVDAPKNIAKSFKKPFSSNKASSHKKEK